MSAEIGMTISTGASIIKLIPRDYFTVRFILVLQKASRAGPKSIESCSVKST